MKVDFKYPILFSLSHFIFHAIIMSHRNLFILFIRGAGEVKKEEKKVSSGNRQV